MGSKETKVQTRIVQKKICDFEKRLIKKREREREGKTEKPGR